MQSNNEIFIIDELNDFDLMTYLQNGLISRATGGNFDMYKYAREKAIQNNQLKDKIPSWVITCRDENQFWSHIKKIDGYQKRREFIWSEFEPILNELEFKNKSTLINEIKFDEKNIQDRWNRALERQKDDPEGAITLSRTLLEDLFKFILDEEKIEYNKTNSNFHDLYKKVSKFLNLTPEQHTEQIFKQILGSISGVVTGLSSLRNTMSDAHGKNIKPSERHSELSINLAGAMAIFIYKTYKKFKEQK
ncbi:abortive infection family protein [Campylobacter sputorum]|uniref:abortive infection family protein n=1 Tax=Campylobacter sputorum TaxID=206 RepID=UPI001896A52C|nr:abortive infection family protein [Campylobacter sp. RM11259]MBF6677581.1 abortive infection family protein [Campylobacter sp. RM11259]